MYKYGSNRKSSKQTGRGSSNSEERQSLSRHQSIKSDLISPSSKLTPLQKIRFAIYKKYFSVRLNIENILDLVTLDIDSLRIEVSKWKNEEIPFEETFAIQIIKDVGFFPLCWDVDDHLYPLLEQHPEMANYIKLELSKKFADRTDKMIESLFDTILDYEEEKNTNNLYTNIIHGLLQTGINVNAKIRGPYNTNLIAAIAFTNIDIIKELLKIPEIDILATSSDNNSPLHWAAEKENPDIIKIFLDKGVSINIRGVADKTPLHWAAENGYDKNIKLLLDNGANIDVLDDDDNTPLHLATKMGHVECVDILINNSNSRNINIKNNNGRTPIHLAAEFGNCIIVKKLSTFHGIDANIRDKLGMTPLHYAINGNYIMCVVYLLTIPNINVNITYRGNDPITMARKNRSYDIDIVLMRFLRNKRDLYYGIDIDNVPPLHRAVITYNLELFHEKIRDPSAHGELDMYGMTPLLWAVSLKREDMAIRLMSPIANPNPNMNEIQMGRTRAPYKIMSKDGYTVEDIAEAYKLEQVIDKLNEKKEWKKNNRIGFHQTDPMVAELIQGTPSDIHPFIAGTRGYAGPGIYFATSIDDTHKKALHRGGGIFECKLWMGTSLIINTHEQRGIFEDMMTPFADVMYSYIKDVYGAHSVHLQTNPEGNFLPTGDELIVYNPEQVVPLAVNILNENSEIVKREELVFEDFLGGGQTKHKKKTKKGGGFDKISFKMPIWLYIMNKNDLELLKKFSNILKEEEKNRGILGTTPLMVAAARGNTEIFQWLLSHSMAKEWLTAKDAMGRGVLFYAMRGGNEKIVKSLINHVNLLEKDLRGRYVTEYFRFIDDTQNEHKYSYKYRQVLIDALYQLAEKNVDAIPALLIYHMRTLLILPKDITRLKKLKKIHDRTIASKDMFMIDQIITSGPINISKSNRSLTSNVSRKSNSSIRSNGSEKSEKSDMNSFNSISLIQKLKNTPTTSKNTKNTTNTTTDKLVAKTKLASAPKSRVQNLSRIQVIN